MPSNPNRGAGRQSDRHRGRPADRPLTPEEDSIPDGDDDDIDDSLPADLWFRSDPPRRRPRR